MFLSLGCSPPPWRSLGTPRFWLRVLASPYSTSAILYSPSPLKMDARSIYNREWAHRNPDLRRKKNTKWLRENRDERLDTLRAEYQRNVVSRQLYDFMRRNDWPLQDFTWKTHTPMKTKDKVKRACASCGRYQDQGLRLWWKRKNPEPPTADSYDCFACFYTYNPENVAPIGYESLPLKEAFDVMREARKQQTKSVSKTPSLPSEDEKPR